MWWDWSILQCRRVRRGRFRPDDKSSTGAQEAGHVITGGAGGVSGAGNSPRNALNLVP